MCLGAHESKVRHRIGIVLHHEADRCFHVRSVHRSTYVWTAGGCNTGPCERPTCRDHQSVLPYAYTGGASPRATERTTAGLFKDHRERSPETEATCRELSRE